MTTIGPNFLLISALSCITLNGGELNSVSISRDILPSVIISYDVPLHYENYSIKESRTSNETISSSERKLIDEYNVIASFANKILSENSPIDFEIQNVIDKCFWEML